MEYKFGDLKVIVSSQGQVRLIDGANEIYVGFPDGVRFNMILKTLNLAKDTHVLNSYADQDAVSEESE